MRRMNRQGAASLLTVIIGIGLPGIVEGQTIGYSVAFGELVALDLETGASSVVGTVGGFGFDGLTMAADGSLYGVSSLSDDLWRIDPADGNGTRIGPLNVTVTEATGLAFDTCGVLWMFTGGSGRLYEVDPGTGDAAFVRDFGVEIRGLTSRGTNLLAIVRTDETRLAKIDPRAGTLSVFGEPVFIPVSTSHHGLDFDSQGRLWGVFWFFNPIAEPGVSTIASYDPLNGQLLSTLDVERAVFEPIFQGNLAITPPQGICGSAASDIPGLSASGVILLATLLAGTAVVLLRVRRGAAATSAAPM